MFGLCLTLLKPFNAFLAVCFILKGSNYLASATLLWLMVADIFDGFLFERSPWAAQKWLRRARRIFNTVGDYTSVQTVLIIMIFFWNFPVYLYLIETAREIILLSIWYSGYRRGRPPQGANLCSRISIFSVGMMAIIWLTAPQWTNFLLIPIILFGSLGANKHYRTTQEGVE